jgi:hypothetical protein
MNGVEKYIADAPEHVRTRIYSALQKIRYIASEEGHDPCRCGGIENGEVCSNICFCDWAKDINFAIDEMFLR